VLSRVNTVYCYLEMDYLWPRRNETFLEVVGWEGGAMPPPSLSSTVDGGCGVGGRRRKGCSSLERAAVSRDQTNQSKGSFCSFVDTSSAW
jgi:hypothetical protein